MAVDFNALLAKPADQVEKPKPIPAGSYNGAITKFEFKESKEKKTPYVQFALSVHSNTGDVDAELLEGVDLSKKALRKDYYLTEDAMWRLVEMLESLGISKAGRSIAEMIPEAVNQAVILDVTQQSSQDGQEIFNNVALVKGA